MHIEPIRILLLLIALMAGARLVDSLRRRKIRRALQLRARDWQMHYSARDQFNLAARVAEKLPIPGAAEVRVLDLIYGSDGDSYRYLFSAEFTTGVLSVKHRHKRVATFVEPKTRNQPVAWSTLQLADESNDLLAQYDALHAADQRKRS